LKHKNIKSCGSFTALGTGFKYEYDANLQKLDVSHAKTGSALLFIDFDKQLLRDPELFVSTLDKSCQIRALTLTNNTSVDLSEIFDDHKLTPMMVETARLARFGFDLMHDNFDRFERYFCQDSTIRNMRIKRVRKFDAGSAFYSAQLETRHSNQLVVESPTLHGVMSKLSQKIIQDLITREFVSHFDAFAHTLLKASSNVSILSLILNEKFLPAGRLREAREAPSMNSQSKN
jgi:hypothetical protein